MYVDIRQDEPGRQRVREINHGYESVPTLVFPDGSTLTEPSLQALRRMLGATSTWRVPQVASDLQHPKQAATVLGWLGVVGLLAGFALDRPWLMLLSAVFVAIWFGLVSRQA